MVRHRTILLAAAALGLAAAAPPAQAAGVVEYAVVDGYTIPEPLTETPGDPVMGRKWAINRKLGNCLSCHQMPIPEEQFHGETGPALYGVGDVYSEGELRLRIVDPKALNPYSMMPSFHKVAGLNRVLDGFENKPILNAQQIEDIVAYLMTLKDTSRN
ncbi:sulfur oxidation c-type cytochrome SoxX [Roseospira goensis]|uniref:Sulfur-oxidizing protein SoxX n=1 Tax=Roseospira goensis TaxID=391922 RepID=A0A7W6WMP0_9PROT|nr:sulfur oxidation c-type cytochrome SoxX [Roseospira goensis]MBB4287702.1 sulfur-oxidizing protein SoxX [Roseospira goensis]